MVLWAVLNLRSIFDHTALAIRQGLQLAYRAQAATSNENCVKLMKRSAPLSFALKSRTIFSLHLLLFKGSTY